MKKILILSFSPVLRDPRVMRQILCLKMNYSLTVAGFGKLGDDAIEFIGIDDRPLTLAEKIKRITRLLFNRFEAWYWNLPAVSNVLNHLSKKNYNLIIANDLNVLPLALKLSKNNSKILFDAHEYFPLENEDNLIWRILYQPAIEYMCRKYFPEINKMMTVCDGIGDAYHKNYRIKPIIITNAPEFHPLKPSENNSKTIKIIHHGALGRSRKIELMIQMMDYLDERFTLDLMMLPNDLKYLDELKKIAVSNKRIRFISAVSMDEIIPFCNSYDIGVFLLPPTNFNYKYALPNKFFEFIQSRLMVAIGPSPEMANIVNQYDCGVVAEDFEPRSLAQCLNGLDKVKITYYKQQSHKAARELCFENNAQLIRQQVSELLT